jgi:rubrerythrin
LFEGSERDAYEAVGYVEFCATGEAAVGDFHCSECGYGVSVQRRLPLCPMCGGTSWEQAHRAAWNN